MKNVDYVVTSGDAIESARINGKSYWLVAFNTSFGIRCSKAVFKTEAEAEKFIMEVLAGIANPHIVDIRLLCAHN